MMCAGPPWFPSAKEIWWFSSAEQFVVRPRGGHLVVPGPADEWCTNFVVAIDGFPSLVSGCCGSPWAADRPPCGTLGDLRMVGPGGCFGGSAARPTSNYSVSAVCLSMMIFSTALAVYPHWVSWFR